MKSTGILNVEDGGGYWPKSRKIVWGEPIRFENKPIKAISFEVHMHTTEDFLPYEAFNIHRSLQINLTKENINDVVNLLMRESVRDILAIIENASGELS